jgi:transmembrane sensor
MQKNYKNITFEQLIQDDDFIAWVKYPTDENDAFWKGFVNQSADNEQLIQKARLAVQQLAMASQPSIDEKDIPEIWASVEAETKSVRLTPNWFRWSVAASVALLIGFGIGFISNQKSNSDSYSTVQKDSSEKMVELINEKSTIQEITLSDNSKVLLKPNSKIKYEKEFKGTIREVYLTGEAFFDVQKDPQKPFIVYANDVITKVLGTSFNVRAFKNEKVLVTVKTGKVSVFVNTNSKNNDPETKGIVLTPNQQVEVAVDSEKFSRSLIEKPLPIIPITELQKFNFNDAPIAEIFEALNKAYGVEIVYDEETLKNCNLTTSLNNETLFEKLDILCEAIGATYKVIDAQVIISSKGCD